MSQNRTCKTCMYFVEAEFPEHECYRYPPQLAKSTISHHSRTAVLKQGEWAYGNLWVRPEVLPKTCACGEYVHKSTSTTEEVGS
jgi:hypothetical protein